jgi:nucleotide-binding universal stress UspA family protein
MKAQVNEREVGSHSAAQQQISKPRFEKVLVAVDYDASTPEIFEKALELAKGYGSHLLVFHCLQGKMSGMPEAIAYGGVGGYSGIYSQEFIELEEQLLQEATAELHAWLASFAHRAQEEGMQAETDYQVGEPGRRICECAKQWGADLIILGRRGRAGLSELLLGSVSNYVLHHASCSVLVVQH